MATELTEEQKLAVESVIKTAAGIATVIVPQYAAFIVLGQIVAKNAPELYNDIVEFINKKEPTPEEVKSLNDKISALLNNPEAI